MESKPEVAANMENVLASEELKSTCQKVKEHLEETRSRLGEGEVSGILAEAVETITALETRVVELENSLAEWEQHEAWRKKRQKEGIEAAINRGVSFGRPRKEVPEGFEELKQLWMDRKISSREAARLLDIGQDTFLRWARNR